jgi:DNA-binding transcriptional ArsR family regulator
MTGATDRCEEWAVDRERVTQAKQRLLDDQVYAALAETFGALADSNRAKIVYSLVTQELCVCDIACVVGISESAVSQHLRILRTLRLVKQRKEGRMMYYSLNDEHIRQLLDVCLEHAQHQ